MLGHELIVLGGSAGGVEALSHIVADLPADLPAAVCAVIHMPADGPALLVEVLARAGRMRTLRASDGMPIERGCFYVPPPDHHLLVELGHLRVVHGPKENGFRPAVDALFRTAARAYGPRVVGVILTGMLDDGTAGLLAIKRRGGVALVQDPYEALFPSMPQSALRYVVVDAVVPLAEIGPALVRLAYTPPGTEAVLASAPSHEPEVAPQSLPPDLRAHVQANVPLTCPECGGVLTESYDGELLRFHCLAGHSYSRESLVEQQSQALDYSLWSAYNALSERVLLAHRLMDDAATLGDKVSRRRFEALANQAQHQRDQISRAFTAGQELKDQKEEEGP